MHNNLEESPIRKSSADPNAELQALAGELEQHLQPFRERFRALVISAGGTQLANADDLRRFKELFNGLSGLLDVKAVREDGKRCSLQIKGVSGNHAWTGLYTSRGSGGGTGAPANTIPHLRLD